MGVDYRFLPRTTLSYDQFFKYFKQDTVTFDQIPQTSPLFNNGNYQFPNPAGGPGTPLDLVIVWTQTAERGDEPEDCETSLQRILQRNLQWPAASCLQ